MIEKSTTEQYSDYINENILPFIDYDKLHKSYGTDMVYAKGILNLLHEAMVKIYGDGMLYRDSGKDGFVLIPGVIRGNDNGKISLALLTIDTSSSGEYYGADYLCKFGVISDIREDNQTEQGKKIADVLNKIYVPYEYCYTAVLYDDHHIDEEHLSKELKSILKDFHKYKTDLSYPSDMANEKDKKPSLLEGIHESEKSVKEDNKNKPANKKSEQEL